MNYLLEIKLFYDWLETHPLSPASISIVARLDVHRQPQRLEARVENLGNPSGIPNEYAAHNDLPTARETQGYRTHNLRFAGRQSFLHLPDHCIREPACVPQ